MKRVIAFLLILILLLTGCDSGSPAVNGTVVRVQYSAPSAPWLADITDCASRNNVIIQSELRIAESMDATDYDMAMRIGDQNIYSPAYQIDTDELLVIINRQNPSSSLSVERVRELFSGRSQNWREINGNDAPVQVWVFPSGEDIQKTFERDLLDGSPISSAAHLAMTPDEMSLAIANDVNAIGILNRRWKAENVMDVYTVSFLPVLALVPSEPEGAVRALIACMQSTP